MVQSQALLFTSWRNLLFEITLGAVGVPVLVTGIMLLTQGVESWVVAVPVGVFFGALAFAYYAWRFHQRGLKSIKIEDQGITAVARNGAVQRLAWVNAKSAHHESNYGLNWSFQSTEDNSPFVLRDDGFSTAQWDEICGVIRRNLDTHGVKHSSEGLAKSFDEETSSEDSE